MAMQSDGIWSSNGNMASTPYTRDKGVVCVGVLYVVRYAQRVSLNFSSQSCLDLQ